MNICVDIGNTATKMGVFHNTELESFIRFEGHDVEDIIKIISDTTASHCIVSSTVHLSDDYKDKLMTLNGCYVHFFDFKTPFFCVCYFSFIFRNFSFSFDFNHLSSGEKIYSQKIILQ